MAPEGLVDRVKVRFLDCEEVPGDDAITEMLRTVLDRIALRVESDGDLPDAAGSIAVDAAMKALREAPRSPRPTAGRCPTRSSTTCCRPTPRR